MAKKITKEGIKNWFRNNWAYVVAGEAVIATVVLAIVSGKTNDSGVIDPYVIDRAKDDWMDEFESQMIMGTTGKRMTVKQALALGCLECDAIDYLRDKGILTKEMEIDIVEQFEKDDPYSMSVLDTIEGFWSYSEDNSAEGQVS